VGVIADGHHVDPVVLRLIHRAAGPRVRLVSDASAPAGAPPGDYVLAGRAVTSDGERVVTRDSVLAGSAVLLDEMARRWSRFTGARQVHGAPRAGAFADLVVLDDEGGVSRVMRRGCWVR
jgi:N-acetylglucosamine-6-phosphate deacetylase